MSAAASLVAMHLLDTIVIYMSRQEATLYRSWYSCIMWRIVEPWLTRDVAEHLIYRIEGCGLCCSSHLFSLETIVELLGLLMFAALLPVSSDKISVLIFQSVLVNLHI